MSAPRTFSSLSSLTPHDRMAAAYLALEFMLLFPPGVIQPPPVSGPLPGAEILAAVDLSPEAYRWLTAADRAALQKYGPPLAALADEDHAGRAALLEQMSAAAGPSPFGLIRKFFAADAYGHDDPAKAAALYEQFAGAFPFREMRREASIRAAGAYLAAEEPARALALLKTVSTPGRNGVVSGTIAYELMVVSALYAVAGDPSGAAEVYLAGTPPADSPPDIALYVFNSDQVSNAMTNSGQFAEALDFRKAVLKRYGGYADARYIQRTADIAKSAGDEALRRRLLGTAADFFPNEPGAPHVLEELSRLAREKGDADAAKKYDTRILNHPDADFYPKREAAQRLGVSSPGGAVAPAGPLAPVPDPAFGPPGGQDPN